VYEGGKLKQQFKNYGSMNCDGIFHLIFKNSAYTNSQLQRMTAKKIVSIQFTSGTQKPFIISLLPDQQLSMQNTIACVIKEAKTVL